MKVHEYNEMMAYLLRPRQKFAIGGGVIEGEDLGSRKGFAEAKVDDPSQGVKAGDDLGTGIRQITKYSTPRYTASQIGEDISKQRKTLEEAKKDRKFLVDKYKEKVFTYTGKFNYDELIKDPDFEKYWKDRVDGNPIPEVQGTQSKKTLDDAVKKVIDKYKLKKNDYRGIYNAILTEVQRSEQIRKNVKSVAGQKPLISPATLSNLLETFNSSYKPNLGKISTAQMEELLKLSKGELSRLMSKIDTPMPEESMRFVKTSDVSRINKAAVLKDILDKEGITYSKFQRKPGVKSGREYKFVLDPDRKKAAEKFEILKNSKDFGFFTEPKTPGKRLRVILSSLSKASEEYKKYGYGRDSGTINNLKDALNRHLTSLNDKELIKFIKKHPKIENLVTVRFDPNLSDMFKNVKLEDMSIEDIRNKANFEIEHIRGFENVKYDEATKKITDGIGVEYPKNLYILNKGINGSVKKQVENYVANFPKETEKIKKINNYFNKNKITYFNRRTNQYGGYKPTNSAVDLSHFGIKKANELKNLITGTYIDEKGVERVKTSDPNKLIATINEVQGSRGMPKLKGKFGIPLAFLFGGGYFGTGLIKEISEGRNPFSMSVQAAKTEQMPQGSPAQINPVDEEGFTNTDKLLAGTTAGGAAYAARKPLLKTASKVLRPFGFPSVAGGLALTELLSDDPNLGVAGADLLLPELTKQVGVRGILANPFQLAEKASRFGKIGRGIASLARAPAMFTPVGLGLMGIEGIRMGMREQDRINFIRETNPELYQEYLSEQEDILGESA
jgi:hypothetical protein